MYNNATSRMVQYGSHGQYSAANCTVVSDDAWMECQSVPGVGGGAGVSVAVQGLTYSTPVVGYGSPCLTSVSGVGAAGGSTVGGEEVVLMGENFGPVGTTLDYVMYGAGVIPGVSPFVSSGVVYTAASCSVSVAHVTIRCLTSAGVGSGLVWSVSIGGQVSGLCSDVSTYAVNISSSYGAPVLSSVTVVDSPDAPAGMLQTEGGSVVHLYGRNFGPPGAATFAVQGVISIFSVHVNDSLGILVLPVGTGVHKSVTVYVGDRASNSLSALSYARPVIVSATLLQGQCPPAFSLDCVAYRVASPLN